MISQGEGRNTEFMKAEQMYDPQPGGEEKITNTDEQGVVVNKSTTEEGGYDEPVNHAVPEPDKQEEKSKEKNKDQQNHSFKAY